MIPSANIAILLTAPPEKILNIPKSPLCLVSINDCKAYGLIPGKGTYVPNLYTHNIKTVKIILFFKSLAIFFIILLFN